MPRGTMVGTGVLREITELVLGGMGSQSWKQMNERQHQAYLRKLMETSLIVKKENQL